MIWEFKTARLAGIATALAATFAASAAPAATLVVFGATGAIGRVIVNEALSRGDRVVGVSPNPDKLRIQNSHFRAVAGDVTDLASFEQVTRGADAVIISVSGSGKDNLPQNSVTARAAKTAVRAYTGKPDSPYVIQIGGATTMYGTKEGILAHLPFPAPPGSPMYGMLLGHLDALQTYQASKIRWTVLTPPLSIGGWSFNKPPVPQRTGKYRTSTTGFIRDANDKSEVNIADLAVAAVDEAHQQRFVGRRFTVGY